MKFDYGFTKQEKNLIKQIAPRWYIPKFKKRRGIELWDVEFKPITIENMSRTQIEGKARAKKRIQELMTKFRKQEYPFNKNPNKKPYPKTARRKRKVKKVLGEFKRGKLTSHGRKVKKRKRAVAIALGEGRRIERNPKMKKIKPMTLLLLAAGAGVAYWYYKKKQPVVTSTQDVVNVNADTAVAGLGAAGRMPAEPFRAPWAGTPYGITPWGSSFY